MKINSSNFTLSMGNNNENNVIKLLWTYENNKKIRVFKVQKLIH